MQSAPAAVRKFESRVLADFLEFCEHNVAGQRRNWGRQQSGYARARNPNREAKLELARVLSYDKK
jgi:hypothetical protein